jgi:DNA helicase-2/ATP-dependent DNA helicase PcrA
MNKRKEAPAMAGTHPGILDGLNMPQRAAASHGDSPLLIVAGAGSGKTNTLVHRVAYLISRGIPPHRILLVTFTRRAAEQMLRRVEAVLPPGVPARRIWGGTFHAVASRLLRIYASPIGLHPRFTIHDRGDSEDLLRALASQLKLTENDKTFPKKSTCMAIYSYGVNSGRPLASILESHFYQSIGHAEPLAKLFAAYVARKAELNVLDYDDLLAKCRDLLDHAETGPRIRQRFHCVLVDEYQDTNQLQADLLRKLCPDGKGLTVVGDDAQSIYGFRAATVRNILDFPQHFPGAHIATLEQNYRSTQPLLEATNRLIGEATERHLKKLWSARREGFKPQLVTCFDEDEQTDFIIDRIRHHRDAGIPLREQAVLFRASHHSIALETELARHNIPFVKYGGLKFVEAAHVKDLISFLRLAENHRDLIAGTRVLKLLPGIGPKKATEWMELLAGAQDLQPWLQVKAPTKASRCWPALLELLHDLEHFPTADVSGQVRRALGYYRPILEELYDNADSRLSDLEQLEKIAGRFSSRTALLGELAIDPPTSEAELPRAAHNRDDLVLSTMHSAKGLEWHSVFILHASDGMIPLERALHDAEQLEEERRLLYVALTRAKEWLYVCHAENHWQPHRNSWAPRDGHRERSRFLSSQVLKAFQCQDACQFALDDAPPSQRAERSTATRRSGQKR